MILTVAVSLIYSPLASRPGIRPGISGVNLSSTLSSYSRVISSLAANRRISASFNTVIGVSPGKSEVPTDVKHVQVKLTATREAYLQCHLLQL
jgi:hypothetical protein